MPIRSQAQWNKLAVLHKQGKLSKAKFDKLVGETPTAYAKLPERIHPKPRRSLAGMMQ